MASKTRTPPTPDYSGAADQQAADSKAAWTANLQANRPNQENQYGSSSWAQGPDGQWTQSTRLNDQQQNIFDSQQNNQQTLAGKVGGMLGGFDNSQISFDGAPGMPAVGQYNQQATDLYNQLAQPQLDRTTAARRAQAAAMGISDLTSRAGSNMEQQLADMTSRSGMLGAQAGIEQGNKMFDQGMSLRKQGVSDILNQRGANLEQLQGLMGLGQEVGTPQFDDFYTGGAYDTPDRMEALKQQYQSQLNTTNAKNADRSGNLSTLGTVASIGATLF